MLARLTNDTSYTLNYDRGRLHKKAVEGLSTMNFDTDLEGEGANFEVRSRLRVLFPHEVYADPHTHLERRLLSYKGV